MSLLELNLLQSTKDGTMLPNAQFSETRKSSCCHFFVRIWEVFVQAIKGLVDFIKSYCCFTSQLVQPLLQGQSLSKHTTALESSLSPDETLTLSARKGVKLPKTFQQVLDEGKELDGLYRGGKIKRVYRPIDSPWVIKTFKSFRVPALVATEVLFYEASKQLHLRVVPKIRYIAPESGNFQSIIRRYPDLSPILVQAYIQESPSEKLDIPHAQEVVLFNWIVGRQDCKRANSAVDIYGKVWEIDNDSPGEIFSLKGQRRDHSWLESNPDVMMANLSEETISKILALPGYIVLRQRFIPEEDRLVKDRVDKMEKTLNENLALLKAIILSLKRIDAQSPVSLKTLNEKIQSQI